MNYKPATFILVAVMALFILLGCDKAESKHITTPAEEQQDKNWREEDISLISIKYKVDVKVTDKIIDEYEELTGLYGNPFREPGTIFSVRETIKKLSQKYQIQEEILASILIDMKGKEQLWRKPSGYSIGE